jgi:hypothetical protein
MERTLCTYKESTTQIDFGIVGLPRHIARHHES